MRSSSRRAWPINKIFKSCKSSYGNPHVHHLHRLVMSHLPRGKKAKNSFIQTPVCDVRNAKIPFPLPCRMKMAINNNNTIRNTLLHLLIALPCASTTNEKRFSFCAEFYWNPNLKFELFNVHSLTHAPNLLVHAIDHYCHRMFRTHIQSQRQMWIQWMGFCHFIAKSKTNFAFKTSDRTKKSNNSFLASHRKIRNRSVGGGVHLGRIFCYSSYVDRESELQTKCSKKNDKKIVFVHFWKCGTRARARAMKIKCYYSSMNISIYSQIKLYYSFLLLK